MTLRDRERSLVYPGNQAYDPETLEPRGAVTARRVELLPTTLPQLLDGGTSLLDIGSSKGFLSLHLRDRFERIRGVEMSADACELAEAVRQHQGLEHIDFRCMSFRDIDVSKAPSSERYDVVYAGSVHHHFVKDALLHGAPMFMPLAKLAALAERLLILDGPFAFDGDCSLTTWERTYGWAPDVRAAYTFEAHVAALAPEFELVHGPVPNERGRHAAVFERRTPAVPRVDMPAATVARIRTKGQVLHANKAREEASVVRSGDVRYKFDSGMQSDGVLGILNAMPEHVAHTEFVITQNGTPIGDCTRWVEGEPIAEGRELLRPWLKFNDALACVGLVEIHYKLNDFVRSLDGSVIDIDVDMVNHYRNIATAAEYMRKWRTSPRLKGGPGLVDFIADNLTDEWVFKRALERVEAGGA